MNFSLLLFTIFFLFTGCNLASGGKEYEKVKIERDGEIHIYSCEKGFSTDNIEIQAKKVDDYLFNKIKDEASSMVNYIIYNIDDENSTKEEHWVDDIRAYFLIIKKSFEFQSNVKNNAEEIVEKFGCVYLENIEEE